MDQTSVSSYSAPLGGATLSMTAVASLILLGVGVLQIVLGLNRQGPVRTLLVGVGSALIVLLFASVLLKIRGYEVTGDRVRILYGLSQREIPLSEIATVSRDSRVLNGSTRVSANGGLWSFLGQFSNPTLGEFDVYVSDPTRLVLLQLKKGAVVVSPGDPDQFVKDVQARRGGVR